MTSESTTKRAKILVTGSVMGGIFLSALDLTAVSPAMPRIVGELEGGQLYAWAFSVYAVLSTTTTPVWGRLADRLGRKPIFLLGIGVFLLGSAACGAAPNMGLFLLARGFQGIGAGALLPTAFTIVGDLYDMKARARIQGYLSGVWGVAAVVGPLVGGTLVATLGWRWVFYLNVPVGVVTAVLIAKNLRESGYPKAGGSLDLLGGTWFSGAILLLLVGLKLGGVAGAATLVAAAGSFGLFFMRERRAESPLFDLSLFRIPVYRTANASGLFSGAVLVGLTAYLPVYVMNVRGGSALESGLTLTPISAGWITAATLGGRLLIRHGYRRVVIPGLVVLVLATFGISRIEPETPWPYVAGLLLVCGFGFGLSLTTFLVAVQEAVGTEKRGQATSTVQFFRQIGGALGVAALELIFVASLKDPSLLGAKEGVALLPAEQGQLMDGFRTALLVASALALASLLPALFSRRAPVPASRE